MTTRPGLRASLTAVLCVLPALGVAQTPAGRKIEAKAGDVILVEHADRVAVIRRREAVIRTVYSPTQRWLVVLFDYADPGVAPDGQVDASYRYYDVGGEWPLGERWDGRTVVNDYSMAGDPAPYGLGLSSATGLIQIVSASPEAAFRDGSAVATLSFRAFGRGGRAPSFDVAERLEVARMIARPGPGSVASAAAATGGPQPVRVGGNIRPPAKTHDVRPVYPDEALRARITGVVILEAVIGVDGRVIDAKVLQSIPILDPAALEAVKQWRFEPTHLNGVPVPVIMTVTVSFNLQ